MQKMAAEERANGTEPGDECEYGCEGHGLNGVVHCPFIKNPLVFFPSTLIFAHNTHHLMCESLLWLGYECVMSH